MSGWSWFNCSQSDWQSCCDANAWAFWLVAFGLFCLEVLFVGYDSADAAFGVLDVALVSGYEVAVAVGDALPCDGAAIQADVVTVWCVRLVQLIFAA